MTRLKTLSVIALSVALIPAGLVLAQSSGGGRGEFAGSGSGGAGGSGGLATSVGAQTVTDVDFGGGPLPEYYEHLQQRTGVRNIILASEDLADVSMPEVRLSSVLFGDAVKLPYFLAELPDEHTFAVDEVGSSKSIFVISVREPTRYVESPVTRSISFDFEGGSLSEFVATVQEIAGAQTVLVRGDAANFTMPPISLENVTLHSVLIALDGDTRQAPSGEQMVVSSERREGVYVVEVMSVQPNSYSQQGPSAVQTMSWSLASMRGPGRLTTDQMLAAIEAAVEVSGASDSTTIRFHDETSLLIVSARSDAIEAIDGVLGQLRHSSEEAARDYQRIQQKRNTVAELESERRVLEEKIHRLSAGIEDVRRSESPGSEKEIQLLQSSISDAEGRLIEIREAILRIRADLERPTQTP